MRVASTDLRERSVRVVADGQPLRQAARRFGVSVTAVSVSAVKRYRVGQQETGSRQRTPLPGGPRTISRARRKRFLRARLKTEPAATVVEHCAWWAEHQGQPLARDDAVAGDAPPGLDASTKALAAVPGTTRRHPLPGGRQSPRATRSRSSWSTRAAPTPP
jgi:transposase